MSARGMVFESESFESEVDAKIQARFEPAAEVTGAGAGDAILEVLSARGRLTALAANILSQTATVAMLRSEATARARAVTELEAATAETAAAKARAEAAMQSARRNWLQLPPTAPED